MIRLAMTRGGRFCDFRAIRRISQNSQNLAQILLHAENHAIALALVIYNR
ncbi:hypothetical protein [Helicobacter sp. 23-1045]